MITSAVRFLVLVSLIFVIGCTNMQAQPAETSWAGKMQNTAKSLQKLLPSIYNLEKFEDPKNKKKLKAEIADFKQSIHSIDESSVKKYLGDDPYAIHNIQSLHELVDRAADSFDRGDTKTANILLKSTTNTCFKCHTRQNMGPESLSWKGFHPNELATSLVEKANLSVAMRQYEEAKNFLAEFMASRESDKNFDVPYENALHYYLMISLRGQKALNPTVAFLQSKEKLVRSPSALHFTLKKWNKDLSYWSKNEKSLRPNLKSTHKVLARNKQVHGDENLINDLMASSLLHEYLNTEPNNTEKAAAYQMLGRIYDDLVVEGYWDLPEVYYELCVRLSPKTKLAQQCYARFRENMVIGYSGSRGTLIPAPEYDRLLELARIAGLKPN